MYRWESPQESSNFALTIYPPEFRVLAMMYLDSFATAMLACCSFLRTTGIFTVRCFVSEGNVSEPPSTTGLALFFICEDDFGITAPNPTSTFEREDVRDAFVDLVKAKEITTRAPNLCNSFQFVYDEIFDAWMDYPGYMKADRSRYLIGREAEPEIFLDIALSDNIRHRAGVALDFARGKFGRDLFHRGAAVPN